MPYFTSIQKNRFYKISQEHKFLIYTIAHLKMMFKVELKYKLTADFIRISD